MQGIKVDEFGTILAENLVWQKGATEDVRFFNCLPGGI